MKDLTQWIPKTILDISADPCGHIVTDEDWNSRWNKNRLQGDDTALKLYDVIQNLYESAWHPTAGAASINNPAIAPASGTTVDAQLTWTASQIADINEALSAHDIAIAARRLIATPITHAETTGRDQADCHTMSSITGLEAALAGIQAGALEAVPHNSLPNRDVADAHPMASVTGLAAFKTAYDALAAAYAVHNHNSNVLVHGTGTIAQKLASIDATIAAITGDMSEITHSDLAGRLADDAHPISAITGLQTAIDSKQSLVLSGVGVPADTLGNDGDIYIRLP